MVSGNNLPLGRGKVKLGMRQHEQENMDELTLVCRAARGDHEAFRSLVVSYEPRLLAFLTHMLSDPESARDVAQETFLAVFHALPTWQLNSLPAFSDQVSNDETFIVQSAPLYPTAHPLAPWLYRIATNRAISLLRKQTVRAKTYTRQASDGIYHHTTGAQPELMAVDTPSLEDQYVARELLRDALSRLPEADAACLVLHFVEGERYGEIASRLGLSSEAVRKRVSRALNTLRKVYKALDTEAYS